MPPFQALVNAAARREGEEKARAAQTVQSTANDIKKAQLAGVDLNVFGIPLGRPLALPNCPEAAPSQSDSLTGMLGDMASVFGVHDKPETTCIPQRASAGAFQMLMGPSAIEGPGLATYVVYLAADKCPNWVDASCTLLVRTMDGYAVEAHFKTAHASSVDIIEAALTKKYKNAPTKGGESVCRNSATSIVTARSVCSRVGFRRGCT